MAFFATVCADDHRLANERFWYAILVGPLRGYPANGRRQGNRALVDLRYVDLLDVPMEILGEPRIPGALAWLDCSVSQCVDAGDHYVYIGQVESAEHCDSDTDPLVYYKAKYRQIS